MPDYRVVGWKLSDFTGPLADPANATDTTGTFAVGTSVTLDAAATQEEFYVTDDDADLEDAYIETGALSTLTNDLILDGVTYSAGSNIEAEFLLVTDDIPPITFIVGRIGDAGSNSGENLLVFTNAPITPGQTYTFASVSDGPVEPYDTICFTQGTLIDTTDGPVAVEDLMPGDTVLTRDDGEQPVRWVGHRRLSSWDLRMNPDLRPIRMIAHGPDGTDLVVSPQHRVLVAGWKAELLFGVPELLAPAKALCNDRSVRVDHDCNEVSYYHVLLPVHGLVRANGQWAESLLPGPQALKAVCPSQMADYLHHVADGAEIRATCALPMLNATEAELLA